MSIAATPDPLAAVVMERITTLWDWHRHFHRKHRWPAFAPIRQAHDAELRALVRLARAARRQAEADTLWRVGARPGAGWTEPDHAADARWDTA